MSPRLRRSLTGIVLALSFTLLTATVAQAAPAARGNGRTVHRVTSGWNLLHVLWDLLVGDNPYSPKPTQGPTVDPNGLSVH